MLQKRIQIDGVTIPASNDQLRLRRQSEERIHLASPKRLHNAVLHLEHLTRTRPIERARVVPRLLVEAPKHRTPHRDNNQDRIAPPAGIVQQSRQRGLHLDFYSLHGFHYTSASAPGSEPAQVFLGFLP